MSPKYYYFYIAKIRSWHDGKVRRIKITARNKKDARKQAEEYHGDIISITTSK